VKTAVAIFALALPIVALEWLAIAEIIQHLRYYADIAGPSARLADMTISAGTRGTLAFSAGSLAAICGLIWVYWKGNVRRLRFVASGFALAGTLGLILYWSLVIHGNIMLVRR
jgi:hypothetical protein